MSEYERFFNTAGPIVAEIHYHVPPLERLDLDEVLLLIRQWKYFVLHAPRQTGKTSALLALRDLLNSGSQSDYRCVYMNVEGAQAAREDVGRAMRTVIGELVSQANWLGDEFPGEVWLKVLEQFGPDGALRETLSRWAAADPKPLVLLIDEIDALVGDSLVSVLRQLRGGYAHRPQRFPQSVVLCGVRDVRDYRIHASSENAIITGGSAFNIKAESLRLGDFSAPEANALLDQHTAATDQTFTDEARRALWALTQGQPWLVNALAYEICFRSKAGRDRGRPVTETAVQAAREALILRRETHLDQLADKLQEERVRRVVEPLLSGALESEGTRPDDLQYVRDLGLIAQDNQVDQAVKRIANPLYREVIPRDLTWITQAMSIHHEPAWYIGSDGRLQAGKLLAAFQQFYREHSEHWVERFQYKEAGPQLLLQAFLQRIVNSGGRIEREYGLGRMRTDLLVLWPAADGGAGASQRIVIECKVLHGDLERTLAAGIEQTRAYMDWCAADEGHLVVFDRTPGKLWDDKVFQRKSGADMAQVVIWGM